MIAVGETSESGAGFFASAYHVHDLRVDVAGAELGGGGCCGAASARVGVCVVGCWSGCGWGGVGTCSGQEVVDGVGGLC